TPQRLAPRACEQDNQPVQHWLSHAYPAVEQDAREVGAEIHWLDHSGLRSDCACGRGWAPRGKTPAQEAPGRRFGASFLATPTNLGVMTFLVYGRRFNAALLIEFLEKLLADRGGRKVYLILDRHPSHTSLPTQAWARANAARIRLEYLPAYSTQYNPVEYL